jgi:lipoprotein NlpD
MRTLLMTRPLSNRATVGLSVLAATLLLTACGTGLHTAPVEDRRTPRPAVDGSAIKQSPGFENAGKPGYYMVKPGETLIRIGLETGQNWKDIARWNNLAQPNQIEVGQVLRVVPPASETSAAVARPVNSGSVVTSPVTGGAAAPAPASRPADAGDPDNITSWAWPSVGPVLAGFDEVKNKGVDLGGNPGDAVLAAADGRVVYVGAGLRGYGNLIILKHNSTYLTAYAHNQALLVKEDQSVRKGQKIAEMGNSDADRVKLHFEVRRQGKPVDPLKYLPGR